MVLPQEFPLFSFSIRYYGLTMATAVLVGFFVAQWRLRFYKLSSQVLEDNFLYLIIFGFLGARVYHVFSNFSYYWQSPLEIFQVWHGGLAIFGSILGGLLATLWITRKEKIGIWVLLDWLTPSLILGQAIGRIGNLFNYELLGKPMSGFLSIYVPEEFRPYEFSQFSHFLPFAALEAVCNLALFFIILWLEKRYFRYSGKGLVFAVYLVGFGFIRFILETQKIEGFRVSGLVPFNVLAGAALMILGIFIFIRRKQVRV